jgi:hypothetical protein
VSDDPERTLVRKLVERLHLSVVERRSLPAGRARLSLVVDSVVAVVRETGCFPANADPDGAFDGAMIVADRDGYAVHWRYEIGVGRYGTTRVERFTKVRDAALAVARSWDQGIDGVPIDETG